MSDAPKQKRSRNGCNECRRLHRRCGEEKPECLNCREAGKVCSYQKPLSWGGRPFKKSAFGQALESGVVEIPNVDSKDTTKHTKSFVYGQAESSSGTAESSSSDSRINYRLRNMSSGTKEDLTTSSSTLQGSAFSFVSVPWLSKHHQMLVHHFVESTTTLFTQDSALQGQIRSTIMPMAVDSNHGFSLLAAILSLASTHRMNLGLHQDVAEIEYWRDMSVGHLRRPAVQEYDATQNVLAATALILCVRDVISESEKPCAWRLHLHGAFTTLTCDCDRISSDVTQAERILKIIARSLEVHSLLPTSSTLSCAGCIDIKDPGACHETLGFPDALARIFKEIRSLRVDKNALHNIESSSSSSNMEPMWAAIRGQCLDLIVKLRNFSKSLVETSESFSTIQVYSHTALIQIYFGLLDVNLTDPGFLHTFDVAWGLLRVLRFEQTADADSKTMDPHLVFPLFTIGCLLHQSEDKSFISESLESIATVLGKGNARLANVALEALWRKAETMGRALDQGDVDEYLAEQGWDLSLW